MLVQTELIHVDERIRTDRGDDWDQFKASFLKYGQLQSIKIEAIPGTMKYRLIAGWRRLTAITELHSESKTIRDVPPGMIEVTYGNPVPIHMKLLQEFAENNERADFSFLDKAKFIRKFHEQMQAANGADAWTQELTAHSLNLSPASISHYLRVEEAAAANPTIAKAATLQAAVKRMKVDEKIKGRTAAALIVDDTVVTRSNALLALADAREWIRSIESGTVDFVNFDPPWGDNTSRKSAENHEEFDDSSEYSDKLMCALLPEIFRVLRQDRFCVFWYRLWATERIAALAESYGFNLTFTRSPCIWYKPDKVSDQNRFPEKQLIEVYETFYILRKGDPVFHERFVGNIFAFDRVPVGSLIHPTEKPLELCNALVRLCTVPGELVIDPTAGSAATLESAVRLGRKIQGCEISPVYHERGIARIADFIKTFSTK